MLALLVQHSFLSVSANIALSVTAIATHFLLLFYQWLFAFAPFTPLYFHFCFPISLLFGAFLCCDCNFLTIFSYKLRNNERGKKTCYGTLKHLIWILVQFQVTNTQEHTLLVSWWDLSSPLIMSLYPFVISPPSTENEHSASNSKGTASLTPSQQWPKPPTPPTPPTPRP